MPNPNVNLFAPQPDADLAQIERRRAMAQALQQQGMAPIPQQQGVPIAPTQGLAKVLKAGLGGYMANRADQQAQALQQSQQQRRGADVNLLVQALQGRQAQPAGLSEDAAGNVTPTDPVAAQSPVQSLGQAIPMMGPQAQGMGLQAMMGAQQREDQQKFQAGQNRESREARLQERLMQIDAMTAQAQGNREFQEKLTNMRADLQKELVQLRSDLGGDRPYYQFLPTSTGYMAGNARSGQVTPVMHESKPVVPAAQDPNLQGDIARNKAAGKETGEAQATAQIDLPRVVDNANNALSIIDQMVGSEDGKVKPHPGFQSYVGATLTPGLRFIEGTDTAGFEKFLNQSKGGAFLEAFNSLKGGGQITEVEGKKATDAITRMDKAQKESEFIRAAREYQEIIRKGVARAKQKAGGRPAYTGPERRVPQGVDPALWSVMTPEEKAAWSQ